MQWELIFHGEALLDHMNMAFSARKVYLFSKDTEYLLSTIRVKNIPRNIVVYDPQVRLAMDVSRTEYS